MSELTAYAEYKIICGLCGGTLEELANSRRGLNEIRVWPCEKCCADDKVAL